MAAARRRFSYQTGSYSPEPPLDPNANVGVSPKFPNPGPDPVDPNAPGGSTAPAPPETIDNTPPRPPKMPRVISDEEFAERLKGTPTNPNLVQYGGTGLYEGPQNDWGMDKSGAPLPGFPQWDTATSLKYRFGREVAKYAPTAENAQKVIQDALAAGWDIRPDDKDQTMFWFNNPELGTWEPVRLLSGSNTWEFNWGSNATGGNPSGGGGTDAAPIGPFAPPAPAPILPTGTTGGGTASGGSTSPATSGGAGSDSAIAAAMQAALLKILQQPEITPESLEQDPAVRAQRIGAQRAEERQRAQIAEQNAFEGFSDSGAEQTDLAGLRQQRGESEANFIGQVALQQMQARREEILRGIEIATQQGQFREGQALSLQLANLDAAIRREQIAATMHDNEQQRALQRWMTGQQLSQQDRQFLLSLGFDYDQLETNTNADATKTLLRSLGLNV